MTVGQVYMWLHDTGCFGLPHVYGRVTEVSHSGKSVRLDIERRGPGGWVRVTRLARISAELVTGNTWHPWKEQA